jgi:hypothetical protein
MMNNGKHLSKVTQWQHYEENCNMCCDRIFSQLHFSISAINYICALFYAVPLK